MSSEDNAVEESLAGGMGCVAADDVDDGLWEASGRSSGLLVEGLFEEFAVVRTGEAFPLWGGFKEEVEAVVESHRERAWSIVREHPRGSALGSRPRRVKEPSGWAMAKSCV